MQAMSETTTILSELENRIQKLISLHKELKARAALLQAENQRLQAALKQEQENLQQVREGLRLKHEERSATGQNIGLLKRKINDIISEIDKSVLLINEQK